MAKKETPEALAEQQARDTTALATAANLAAQGGQIVAAADPELLGGFDVVGDERSAIELMPRVAMYFGTPEEDQKYTGIEGLKRGDLIVINEKRRAASRVMVPVVGVTNYVKWPDGAKVPEYVHSSPAQCPPGDCVFGPAGEPPVASKVVSMVVLIDGEPSPMMFNFKSTSLRAYESMRGLENTRRTTGRTVGGYAVEVAPDKNSRGESYFRMAVRCIGDIPATLIPLFKSLRSIQSQAALKARAQTVAATPDADFEIVDEAPAATAGGSIPF